MLIRLPSLSASFSQPARGLCRLARLISLLGGGILLLAQTLDAMPRPPRPPYPERYLQGWRFDDPAWLIQGGWEALGFLNFLLRESE